MPPRRLSAGSTTANDFWPNGHTVEPAANRARRLALLNSVPEPSSWVLGLIGLATLLGVARLRLGLVPFPLTFR